MIFARSLEMPHTAMPSHSAIHAEFLDFRDKSHGDITVDEISSAISAGRFVWIDTTLQDQLYTDLKRSLPEWLAGQTPVQKILSSEYNDDGDELVSSLHRTDDALHIRLVGACDTSNKIISEVLDIVICEDLLATFSSGSCGVLHAVRRDYIRDFEQHAATPSFLLYEFWDKQIEQFLSVQGCLDEEVESTRTALRRSADEKTLTRLANVSGRLLALRKRVLPARRVLEELVSRKTTLVSEATLQYLSNMIGTLERLLADITANREILESAMNFSLTVMTHRTNMTMNRLAVVSTIFLPLTFLCGVYGMNFEIMPETEWVHGYKMFWIVSAIITLTLTIVLRKARLL
jgi:magnesium transporter|tara:strand:- start:2035 stop:3075 length:1041 start_codon:yes stop_codon:yes gene_type:complete